MLSVGSIHSNSIVVVVFIHKARLSKKNISSHLNKPKTTFAGFKKKIYNHGDEKTHEEGRQEIWHEAPTIDEEEISPSSGGSCNF